MGPSSPEAWMAVMAAQQRQPAKEHQRLLQYLAKQRSILEKLVAAQAQTSQQLL